MAKFISYYNTTYQELQFKLVKLPFLTILPHIKLPNFIICGSSSFHYWTIIYHFLYWYFRLNWFLVRQKGNNSRIYKTESILLIINLHLKLDVSEMLYYLNNLVFKLSCVCQVEVRRREKTTVFKKSAKFWIYKYNFFISFIQAQMFSSR